MPYLAAVDQANSTTNPQFPLSIPQPLLKKESLALYPLDSSISVFCAPLVVVLGESQSKIRTITDAADQLGISYNSAQYQMSLLIKQGVAHKEKGRNGLYQLANPFGKDYAHISPRMRLDKALHDVDLAVWSAIFCHGKTSGKCFPSDYRIAELANIKIDTVRRSKRRLANADWLRWEDKRGRRHYSKGSMFHVSQASETHNTKSDPANNQVPSRPLDRPLNTPLNLKLQPDGEQSKWNEFLWFWGVLIALGMPSKSKWYIENNIYPLLAILGKVEEAVDICKREAPKAKINVGGLLYSILMGISGLDEGKRERQQEKLREKRLENQEKKHKKLQIIRAGGDDRELMRLENQSTAIALEIEQWQQQPAEIIWSELREWVPQVEDLRDSDIPTIVQIAREGQPMNLQGQNNATARDIIRNEVQRLLG